MDWLRSEFRKWGVPSTRAALGNYPALSRLDARTRSLFEKRLPRGVLMARTQQDRERVNYLMSPGELQSHRYRPGQLLIGKIGNTFLGHLDDRPILSIAGPRAGKTSTVLEPNLYLYSGSMLVLDPKGDLASAARYRRTMGHNVYVWDPFGQTDEPSASINVLDELDPDDLSIIDDVLAIVHALIPESGEGNAKFFNDSARTLLLGLILLTLTFPKSERNLVTTRELLSLSYRPLVDAARAAALRDMRDVTEAQRREHFSTNGHAMRALLNQMEMVGDRFGGVASGIARRLQESAPNERASVWSTASVHTDFLDSLRIRKTLRHSDFSLSTLRSDRPATIFLCLPVGRLEQHSRFLRLMIQLSCNILERMGSYPRTKPPIIFMLEEWPVLGTLKIAEQAAAYFPSFGICPWFIAQDVSQIKRNYQSWSSFLGSAGLVQLFSNGDTDTIDYVVKRLGKLITPWELELAFAREHEGQLLLMKGQPAAAAMRLSHDDVERIRERAELVCRQWELGRR